MSNKIQALTKEQEAQIPVYLEHYRKVGLSTRKTDRAKAEVALRAAYKYLKLQEPEIFWAESPFAGAVIAAQLLKGSLTVTKQEVSDQASKASYGSLEAYWVSFYAFIGEQLPVTKDELLDIVKDVADECGVYWTFEDAVVLTDKPTKIIMDDGKLSCEDGMALEYADGSGVYAYKGVKYNSLLELKLEAILKNETSKTA